MNEEKEELKENKNNNKPMSKKKVIGLILLVLLITAIVVVILINVSDFNKTMELISHIDSNYLWIAIAMLILYLITWPLSLMLIGRSNKIKVKKKDSFLIGASEHFFNAITPFSSGGQPIQIYLYTQSGVDASTATGMVLTNFIAFMIATNAYAISSLFFFGDFSKNFDGRTLWIIILGFFMNLFTLFFIIMLAVSKKVKNILVKLLTLLGKIKFLKKLIDKALPKFIEYCDNYQLASKEILSHKFAFVMSILLRGISLSFYYSIPYFALKALGVDLNISDLIFIILASSFAITTMVWVPTPGGMGGIEFAFMMIFTSFAGVTDDIANAGMIVWRFLTYYLLMVLSFITYITYEIIVKRRKKNNME